jgi:hypothetical protein
MRRNVAVVFGVPLAIAVAWAACGGEVVSTDVDDGGADDGSDARADDSTTSVDDAAPERAVLDTWQGNCVLPGAGCTKNEDCCSARCADGGICFDPTCKSDGTQCTDATASGCCGGACSDLPDGARWCETLTLMCRTPPNPCRWQHHCCMSTCLATDGGFFCIRDAGDADVDD